MKNCKANRCPLPADFITHWETNLAGLNQPKWGVCRYHREADPDDWLAVTSRIEAYHEIVRGISMLTTIREPIFMIQGDEPFAHWLARTEKYLRNMILGRQESPDAAENFKKIIQLLSE